MDICVLVRVHSRMADLEISVAAVRRHWRRHRYHLVVLSSGRPDGFGVPPSVGQAGAVVVECGTNPGHIEGNSRLLLEGIQHVPADCPYTILLEADTWVHTDAVLDGYIARMDRTGAVWASAEWVEKYRSLALDCAVVQSAFLRDHPDLFRFPAHAEHHVAQILARERARALLIREHMPVHVPLVLRGVIQAPQGRLRCFPAGAMVTHHLEDLAGGIVEKQRLANATLGRVEYDVPGCEALSRDHRRAVWLQRLARAAPRSSWFRRPRSAPAAWTSGSSPEGR